MASTMQSSVEDYLELLQNTPQETFCLLDSVGVNVSSFFRDTGVFEAVSDTVLPRLIAGISQNKSKELRVWSAGCSHGEEAYSVAIMVKELLKKNPDNVKPLIFATDMDQTALMTAKTAVYSRSSLEDTKLGLVDRYFTQDGDVFKLKASIKRMVHFSTDDLLSEECIAPRESLFGDFDIIFCRNVIIYFNNELQERVLTRLSHALAPGGYLVLGMTETLLGCARNMLETVDKKHMIFRKPN